MLGEIIRSVLPEKWHKSNPMVPVLRLSGPIGLPPSPLRQSLTMAGLAGPLKAAFRHKRTSAVAIIINSPGGSPVQSTLIFKRIRDLAEEHDKKVWVFVEDVAASGGYLIALAGDEIIVDASSIVGSIGVVSSGFGFDRAIDKLGIDRRLYTSGDRKAQLDPFSPEKADEVRRIKALQKDIHENFIALVKDRRKGRLDGTDKLLFSGEFWTGSKGVELGLVDRLGEIRSVLREEYGEKVRLVPVQIAKRGLFGRMAPGVMGAGALDTQSLGHTVGHGMVEGALNLAEERSLWARYGL